MKVWQTPQRLLIELADESETCALSEAIAQVVRPGTVIGLVGTLGAGKTRLSRAIAESLGVDPQVIASPTFVLIHEYCGSIPVYHFDTYRLADTAEFEGLGALEYFEAGGLCLVEWADRVAELLPQDAWWIHIETGEQGPEARTIEIEAPPHILRELAGLLRTE